MEVRCRTNLDLYNESWPTSLPCVPAVGQHIESATVHRKGFRLQLEVVRVTWIKRDGLAYMPEIELHMADFMKRLPSSKPGAAVGSITAFYEWYAPLVGKSVSYFCG